MLNVFKQQVEGVELAGTYLLRAHLRDYVLNGDKETEIMREVGKIVEAYSGDGPFTPCFTLVRPQPKSQPDVVHIQVTRRRHDTNLYLGVVELRWVEVAALRTRYLEYVTSPENFITVPNVVTLRTAILQPHFRKAVDRLDKNHRRTLADRLEHYENIEGKLPNEFEFSFGLQENRIELTVRRSKRMFSSYSFYFD